MCQQQAESCGTTSTRLGFTKETKQSRNKQRRKGKRWERQGERRRMVFTTGKEQCTSLGSLMVLWAKGISQSARNVACPERDIRKVNVNRHLSVNSQHPPRSEWISWVDLHFGTAGSYHCLMMKMWRYIVIHSCVLFEMIICEQYPMHVISAKVPFICNCAISIIHMWSCHYSISMHYPSITVWL